MTTSDIRTRLASPLQSQGPALIRRAHICRVLVPLLIVACILVGQTAQVTASGPPGPDWRETHRCIIYQTKDLTIWLVTYRKEPRQATAQRLRDLKMADVLNYVQAMEDQEHVDTIVKSWGLLTDTELRGLGEVCRSYNSKESTTRDFADVIDLHMPLRNHIFHLVGELSEQVTIGKGLASVVDRGLVPNNDANQVGLIGQLRAAQRYASELARARGVDGKKIVVDFEMPKLVGKDFREVDISVTVDGRKIDVEVKTNIADNPSINSEQIRKDILAHVGDDWSNLVYLYPANQESNLGRVRRAFLAEFDRIVADASQGKILDPFASSGKDAAKAKSLLERRLPEIVTSFDLPDLKRKGNP